MVYSNKKKTNKQTNKQTNKTKQKTKNFHAALGIIYRELNQREERRQRERERERERESERERERENKSNTVSFCSLNCVQQVLISSVLILSLINSREIGSLGKRLMFELPMVILFSSSNLQTINCVTRYFVKRLLNCQFETEKDILISIVIFMLLFFFFFFFCYF